MGIWIAVELLETADMDGCVIQLNSYWFNRRQEAGNTHKSRRGALKSFQMGPHSFCLAFIDNHNRNADLGVFMQSGSNAALSTVVGRAGRLPLKNWNDRDYKSTSITSLSCLIKLK